VDPFDALRQGTLGGDPEASRALLEALEAPVRRALAGFFLSSADLDDTLQESLVAIMAALPTFRKECSILGFALRIAVHRALSRRRTQQRSRVRETNAWRLESPLAPNVCRPDEDALSLRRRAALAGLVAALPRAQAETLVLRTLFDYSLEDISRTGGVTINTVKTRLRLARGALRRRIQADPDLFEILGDGFGS
jgi:RNA polymerase sigma-70 factor (ECF subfamily)